MRRQPKLRRKNTTIAPPRCPRQRHRDEDTGLVKFDIVENPDWLVGGD
jgi:hypothetical protein